MSKVDRADFTSSLPYANCVSPIGYETHIEAPSLHATILVNTYLL